MFTGLIEGTGYIDGIKREKGGLRLKIRPCFFMEDLKLGDSVAVNGVCLTVVSQEKDSFEVQLSPETVSRTTFKQTKIGQSVNLERALRLGDRLGGHLVTGHVDTVGVVIKRQPVVGHTVMAFKLEAKWMPFVVEKGSIAVDGVSLTVNKCFSDGFEINIIPHTAQNTTLGQLRVGDKVNIETDIIGKYVAKLLAPWSKGSISLDFLQEHGFSL